MYTLPIKGGLHCVYNSPQTIYPTLRDPRLVPMHSLTQCLPVHCASEPTLHNKSNQPPYDHLINHVNGRLPVADLVQK